MKMTRQPSIVRSIGLSFVGLFLMTVLVLTGCSKSRDMLSVDSEETPHLFHREIESVREKFAPDQRLNVFSVSGEENRGKIILTGESTSKSAIAAIESKVRIYGNEVENNIDYLPLKNLQADTCGIVRLSVVTQYKKPDVISIYLNQTLLGSTVKILKKKSGLYYCQLEDGYLGWVEDSALFIGDISIIQKWDVAPKVVVSGFWGQVKEDSSAFSPSVRDIVFGNTLKSLKKYDDWWQVELPDHKRGFVKTELLTPQTEWERLPKATPERIVKTALDLQGIPYVWGGTSIKGLDCSGFTYTVYKKNGITLKRDANMQVKMGIAVKISENFEDAQLGDLLFFGARPSRITHVGIYIGDMQFIHAEGYVHQNSFRQLDENFHPYRKRTLRAIRRVLQN